MRARHGASAAWRHGPPLGAALCGRLMELGWPVRRTPGQRALRLMDAGRTGLAAALDIRLDR